MDDRSFDEREIEQHWNSLRRDVRRRGVDPATAEDIVQETWLRALSSPAPEGGRLRGWLHVVAGRLVAEMRRASHNRAARERRSARLERVETSAAEPSLLERFVQELPDPYRTVVHLRFFEDRSVGEIAAVLRRPESTVRTQLSRGLERLGSRLETQRKDRRRRLQAFLTWLGLGPRRDRSSWMRAASAVGAVVVVLFGAAWFAARERPPLEPLEVAALVEPLDSTSILRQDSLREAAPLLGPEASTAATPSGPRLRGTVREPDGKPRPGAIVHAHRVREEGGGRMAISDELGRYEIAADDADLVWATHPDWVESAHCYAATSRHLPELDLVLGGTGAPLSVEIVDPTGRAVAGARILVDPRALEVQILTLRGTLEFAAHAPGATTLADGRAELLLPDAPSVEVFVLAEGFAPWNWDVVRGTTSPLRIVLAEPARVRGRVEDVDGIAARNCRVEALQLAGLVQPETTTGADGSFEIAGLGAGPFVVRCTPDATFGTTSARRAGVIAESQPLDLGKLVLSDAGTLTGRVLEGERPVPGKTVTYLCYSSNALCERLPRTTRTDEQGRFTFPGCRPSSRAIVAVLPEGDLSGAREELSVGLKEAVLRVTRNPLRAPIELEFSGGDLPRLVELRTEPSQSVMLTEAGSRFRSPPLPEGKYDVLAQDPELGVWLAGRIDHSPERPQIHHLSGKGSGELILQIELPPGFPPEDVEVLVRCESLNAYGLEGTGWPKARRPVAWDATRQAFVARLVAGAYPYVVQAPGLASLSDHVTIEAGATTRVALRAFPGIETHLVFACERPMLSGEALRLDVQTPAGTQCLLLVEDELQAIPQGVEITTRLPLDASEVRVLSAPRPRVDRKPPLVGKRSIAADELSSAQGVPTLEIQLVQSR